MQQAQLYLVNSPALLSIMGKIAKLLVDKTIQSRLQFLHQPTDLVKYLNPYVSYLIFQFKKFVTSEFHSSMN